MLNKPSKKVENETKTILLHKRREKAVQENMEKFGNVAIGIHGIELPKFSDPLSVSHAKRARFRELTILEKR